MDQSTREDNSGWSEPGIRGLGVIQHSAPSGIFFSEGLIINAGLISTQLEIPHDLVDRARESESGGEIDFVYMHH